MRYERCEDVDREWDSGLGGFAYFESAYSIKTVLSTV